MEDTNVPAAEVEPAALEAAMIRNDEAMGTPADIAAAFFQRNYPRIKHLLKVMSRRSIERSVICAASYPLVPDGYKPKNQQESELAWVIEQMVACKVTMIEQMKLHKLNNTEELENEESTSLIKGEKENV